MNIRFVTAQDVEAILRIYAQYINTPITFEYTLPSSEEFNRRVSGFSKDYPYLVCEADGEIVGYAYAHRQKEREAYQWNVELSIYLDQNHTSRGLGKTLCLALLDLLKLQGVRTVYSGVTVPNAGSEGLHMSLGFRHLGTYHNTGYKCGSWHDVALFEKELASYCAQPAPVMPISEAGEEECETILQKYNCYLAARVVK